MDIVDLRELCLSLPHTVETLPFDDDTLVFKVGGRMFAVVSLSQPDHMVVKCDPERAEQLRERCSAVTPAPHFNKRHWNSIRFDGELTDADLRAEVLHSYRLVVQQNVTPRTLRDAILAEIAASGLAE